MTVRLATSLISLDQAKKNLAMEIPDSRTFDQVRDAAQTRGTRCSAASRSRARRPTS